MSSRRAFLHALGAGGLGLITGSCASRSATGAARGAGPPVPATAAVIRLGSNENSHGPGPAALEAIQRSLSEANRYPYDAHARLQHAVAAHAGVSPGQVVIACGSSELLDAAVSAFASAERGLVTASPTFERPERRARAAGAPIVSVPVDDGGGLDLEGLLGRAAGAGLIYLCNPNNPTATVRSAADVRAFVERVQTRAPGAMVLIDEAYHEYADDPAYATAIPLAVASSSVIVARTFSKLYGMAGLRAGYAVGQPAALARMAPWLSGLGMSVIAADAAVASLADKAHVQEQQALNREARRFTLEAFSRAGCRAFASEANFVMVDVARDCRAFAGACSAHGVRIARAFPPLTTHARITIGTMDEMRRAVAVFSQVLASPASQTAGWVVEENRAARGC